MTNYYVDDYGRLRYNQTQNPRITVPTFDYWMRVFNAAEVSAATATSAAPTVSGSQNTDQSTQGGPDVSIADNQANRGNLPEYDNVRDFIDAVTNTPSIMGPGVVTDAVRGSGLFSAQEPSYVTVNGQVMNPGNPTIAEMRGVRETNAAVTAANKSAGIEDGDYEAAIASGNEAFSGDAAADTMAGAAVEGATGRDAADPDGIGLAKGGLVQRRELRGRAPNVGDNMVRKPSSEGPNIPNAAERKQKEPPIPMEDPRWKSVDEYLEYKRKYNEDNSIGLAEGGEVMFESNKDVPGPVDGPGGPKTDSVPANLSDGEYVNTAEAVQSFGQSFFDQVNQIAKMPGAPSLMSNPDFQKMQNEFLGNVSSLAQQPPTGNVPPPDQGGLMAPSVGAPVPPAGGPGGMPTMGMAEGGLVPSGGRSVVPSSKGGGLMSQEPDFFDWLMEKFNRLRRPSATATINGDPAIEDQRPRPKLIEDAASKAKNMGNVNEVKNEVSTDVSPAKKDIATSAVKTGALSLARRAIPGVGLASAMLEPTPLNANEDEDLKAALSKPDVKESRNKDDGALPFKTKEDSKPSLAKRPTNKDTKQKTSTKTKETENKLAPNASLGDALEFYKRQDAPGFTFKGETYERSSSSPSGYELV